MACLQPSMSNELGGRPPTSEKAGQRLMPDRQFPLTIKSLGQLWILIRCSMPGELTATTSAGVINWGDVAPNSGLRAPKAAKPRGRMEAQRAGSTWTAPMRASGSRDLARKIHGGLVGVQCWQNPRRSGWPEASSDEVGQVWNGGVVWGGEASAQGVPERYSELLAGFHQA